MSLRRMEAVTADGARREPADAAMTPQGMAGAASGEPVGSPPILRRKEAEAVGANRRDPVDAQTLAEAAELVERVRLGGEPALRELAERFGDRLPGEKLIWTGAELAEALERLPREEREVLERTAGRIRSFAQAQRGSLRELDVATPGGRAGHRVEPMERAGCYAPGGRFPLPSSVLMTVLPAKVAGVREVWVASPRPTTATLAAAAIAGADALLAAGGAQAIAALAYGAGAVPSCDIIVGPGNRWVTAAKKAVSGRVAIDLLAGPSELVILADEGADPALIAADLLAQAEHDPDALPILIALSEATILGVERELEEQLRTLPTADTARAALRNGFAVLARDLTEAAALCDRLAPEHLELLVERPRELVPRLRHYGALFLGAGAAEVLGDYGIGPNHVLPTGGTARSGGGLSVFSFLRVRTWMELDDRAAAKEAIRDAVALARMEGLEAHARSAGRRLPPA